MSRALDYIKQAAFEIESRPCRSLEIHRRGVVVRRSHAASHQQREIVVEWIEIECSEINPIIAALDRMA